MELKAFSPRDAELLVRVARKVLGEPGRPLDARDGQLFQPAKGLSFRNDSGESMPAHAIGAIKDYESADDGSLIAVIEKPSTTFRIHYLVNTDLKAVADGDIGFCAFDERYRISHDTGWTPVTGEGGGPKPGSWLLWKGFPCISIVTGQCDSTNKLLLGTLAPIGTLLCKATADLSEGPVSSNYQIWSGSVASGADSGFTVLPTIEIGCPLKSGDFFVADFVDGGWVAEHPSKEITVVTAQSISGGHLYYKTRLIRVPYTDAESSNVDAGSVGGGGGGGDGVARIIEGYVASPFRTQHSVFRMVITRAYDGTWPQFLGGNAASLMILNFDRLGVAPPNKGPYLFEGEASAACSAHYDPEATVIAGFPIYRVRYVECPEDSPVEDESAGNYAIPLTDSYSQGSPSELVSTYYYGE